MKKKIYNQPTQRKHYPAGNGPATSGTSDDDEEEEETEKSRYHGQSAAANQTVIHSVGAVAATRPFCFRLYDSFIFRLSIVLSNTLLETLIALLLLSTP